MGLILFWSVQAVLFVLTLDYVERNNNGKK